MLPQTAPVILLQFWKKYDKTLSDFMRNGMGISLDLTAVSPVASLLGHPLLSPRMPASRRLSVMGSLRAPARGPATCCISSMTAYCRVRQLVAHSLAKSSCASSVSAPLGVCLVSAPSAAL